LIDKECSTHSKPIYEKPIFIFIGEYLSPSEIHIHNLFTFCDAIHLASKPSFIKENQQSYHYQYLDLDPDKCIHFYYHDQFEKKCGQIYFDKGNLQITMEQSSLSFGAYFLIQLGKKLTYLYYPPHTTNICCNTSPR
jgi:hypothetical protein